MGSSSMLCNRGIFIEVNWIMDGREKRIAERQSLVDVNDKLSVSVRDQFMREVMEWHQSGGVTQAHRSERTYEGSQRQAHDEQRARHIERQYGVQIKRKDGQPYA